MELNQVKYTEDGKAYVEVEVKSGAKKGYITRRFGKILNCLVCKKEFFARNAQLKNDRGKFCSIKCAKTFAKKASREEEISKRHSKKIKDRIVYFRDDGRIYTEKKNNRGKVYRYYGEVKKCLLCGEDFFANFSQIKMDRAKFCSPLCAGFEKEEPPKEEITPVKEEIAPVSEPTPVKEEITPVSEPEPYSLRKKEIIEEEELIQRRGRPIGVLVFGIVIIYIGIYHLIAGLRAYSVIGGQAKAYVLTAANLLLGYGILRMKSWTAKLLYIYVVSIAGATITAYCFAFFVEPLFKTLLFSRVFLTELCFTFIPYIFVLVYLTRPEVKEQFR